ncbi:hypothetical protein [Streptomyces pristinaespiralis]|uniref:hypothetical protein n=1 Tax=Streptomyces pristinaespiralis TaxID=38300 RepID=UPI003838642D
MILVTGAAGALGTLIAQRLGDRDDTILGTRDPGQLQAPLPVRRLDFDEPRAPSSRASKAWTCCC